VGGDISNYNASCPDRGPFADLYTWDQTSPNSNEGSFANLHPARKVRSWRYVSAAPDPAIVVHRRTRVYDDTVPDFGIDVDYGACHDGDSVSYLCTARDDRAGADSVDQRKPQFLQM
jgi:hypothetical protein